MTESISMRGYGTDDPPYVPSIPVWIPPQSQEEEDPREVEKGEKEKKEWPPKDDSDSEDGRG